MTTVGQTAMSAATPGKVFLIDGMSHIFRAYYAIRGLSNSLGVPTNAVYGFATMLRKLIRQYQPQYHHQTGNRQRVAPERQPVAIPAAESCLASASGCLGQKPVVPGGRNRSRHCHRALGSTR